MLKMEKRNISFFLRFFLILQLYSVFQFTAEANKNQVLTSENALKLSNINQLASFNERLSQVEVENQQQKNEIRLLRTTVEEARNIINDLRGRIEQLEVPQTSTNQTHQLQKTVDKPGCQEKPKQLKEGLDNMGQDCLDKEKRLSSLESKHENKFRQLGEEIGLLKSKFHNQKIPHKREATIVKKNSAKICSDSSRLCTFLYPDHPDAKIVKSGSSYNKTIQASLISPSFSDLPTNCKELNLLGHTLNGFHLVKREEENGKKLTAIYCNFQDLNKISETFVGNVQIATKIVHFYVQRETAFQGENSIIPFELEVLNIGKSMNISTGIFTAPVNGIYHFEFSGRKMWDSDYVTITIQVNGKSVGSSFADDVKKFITMTLNASFRLKAGDTVNLFQESGAIHDDNGHSTHFTGWLVEEDLVIA